MLYSELVTYFIHKTNSVYMSNTENFFFHTGGMWDLSSLARRLNLDPLNWEHKVFTTGPPVKSQLLTFDLAFKGFL